MSSCCVIGCRNNYNNNRNLHYFRFPFYKRTDSEECKITKVKQRMAWIAALKNKSTVTIENIASKRVCSAHFVSGEKAHASDVTNPDWMPSVFKLSLPENEYYDNDDGENTTNVDCTNLETVNSQFTVSFPNIQSQFTVSFPTVESQPIPFAYDPALIRAETTEINKIIETMNGCNKNLKMKQLTTPENLSNDTQLYIARLHSLILTQAEVIDDLKGKLKKYKFDLESFRNENVKTRYYTGIMEFKKLEQLYTRLEPHIQRHGVNLLTKSEMLILALMKLRLNLQFTDLAYRYEISPGTARRTFNHIVDVMKQTSTTEIIIS